MGPNELWQPKNAVYFLNEIGQFHFFYRLEVFLQFFWFAFYFFCNKSAIFGKSFHAERK